MSAVLATMNERPVGMPQGMTKPKALVQHVELDSPMSRIEQRKIIGVPEKPQIGTPQVRPNQLNNN
jgi:hypothetical protein